MRRGALALVAATLVTALLFEAGAFVAVRRGWLSTPEPTYGRVKFWQGDDPQLGVWHRPNSEWRHETPCFAVTYRSNSLGARDVERDEHAEGARVEVLGDSFLEGWGVERSRRLSDLLADSTGLDHLNFAMAHFGPYQSLLAYEALGRRFDHRAVLLGVLPANDFVDLDPDQARRLAGYAYRWRPYLVEGEDGWRRFDLREPLVRRVLRERSFAFNALLAASQRTTANRARRSSRPPPGYWDFSERDLRVLGAVLERLRAAAGDRKLAVVLIPTLADVQRLAREGAAPLAARLAPLARRLDFQLVDLLPAMARYNAPPASHFHRCDYHWSASGNTVAAALVHRALQPRFYEPLGSKPPSR